MYVMPCSLVDCCSLFSALNKEIARCMILGFRREVDENRALLEYYAASSGNYRRFGTTSRSHKDGTRRLSRNVGAKLSPLSAQ